MNDELKNILWRVRCLYMKYGIKSVTMDDVARELSISKKTLYQYFTDKNDLVGRVVDLELEEKEKFFSEVSGKQLNAIEEVLKVFKIVLKMLKDYNPATEYDLKKYYPEQYAKIIRVRHDRMYNLLIQNLQKGKDEGLYRSELNEYYIAKMQVSRIEATFDEDLFTPEEIASPKLFYEFFIYHIRGIANEKGLAVLESKLKEFEINKINLLS